jgi:hypothetical protein
VSSEISNSPDDVGVPALRFIPFRRADLRQMLAHDVLLRVLDDSTRRIVGEQAAF